MIIVCIFSLINCKDKQCHGLAQSPNRANLRFKMIFFTGGSMNKFIIASMAVLAGCAAPTESVWVKPGSTYESFSMDKGQCDAQAFSVAGGNLMQIAFVQNGCMRGKGWHLEDRPIR